MPQTPIYFVSPTTKPCMKKIRKDPKLFPN
jgi:uncharacterized pyridoxamine 5'-phosphate oxidase family protein